MLDKKTIARIVQWTEEWVENPCCTMSLEDYIEQCEEEYWDSVHKNAEMDSYFYEIDSIQSYMDGYMESHRREF